MTTPTISDKLGDFSQIQLGPNLPVPIMNGVPGLTVTIANQDILNTITIARRNNFTQNGPNTATIPPLGSITVDAGRTIWGLAPVGTLPPLIFPGGGNWAPSPAQVAAQINALGLAKDTSVNNPSYGPSTLSQQVTQQTAIPTNIFNTGVPLYTAPNQLVQLTTISVAAGTSTVEGPYTISQIGYEITVSAHSAGATATQAKVLMTWKDSTTGITVDQQSWWFTPGSDNGANIHVIKGTGPTENNQLTVTLFAFGNTVVFDSILIHQNSRVYQRHDWRTFQAANLAGGVAAAVMDMPSMVMMQNGVAVAAAGHWTAYSGLFCGKVQIWAHTQSNTNDATLQINANAVDTILTQTSSQIKTDSTGQINVQFYLPRVQIQWVFTNNNAGTQTLSASVSMTDF